MWLSACGPGEFDSAGNLVKVRCPSYLCQKMVVELVNGKIGPHSGTEPGQCPFIGYRVYDDSDPIPAPTRPVA
jgi:hypothetical protein